MGLHRSGVRVGARAQFVRSGCISALFGMQRESASSCDQEPGEPHAFATPFDADPIHSIVPVADSDQRQPMFTSGARATERAQTVLVHSGRLLRDLGRIVHLVLMRLECSHLEKGHALIQHGGVASYRDVVVDDEREPGEVIGKARADAAARLWMPPVLHISFDELAGSSPQNVLASERRLGVDESHTVLQLIAEPERTTTLVQRAACPHAA